MSRELEHHCKYGGTATLVRDVVSFDLPVWRCQGLCGTFFAVVDGELDQVATEPALADWERELLESSDPAGTTETS